ncbi:hypothetical protein [Brevundimonas goettingensis]|uniref:Uncharacterized protein n=1 Tax=Brevundimonas goettingensis TaxID=2774190 RepID=A0A975C1N7_9CAUL|nr:hypothetical protein [Brevundimonas goettingensis]QTC92206.1 hypothetical protein IFJ75_04690 [Brevundimonas goettingensis]
MTSVRVQSLLATELDEALVLARLGAADLDPESWRFYVLSRLRNHSEGGALAARNAAGRLCGLIVYRIVASEAAKPSLEVERLVAFDLLHPRAIADALIAEAVSQARLQDCDSLRLVRPLDTPADTTALVLASGLGDLHSVF